MSADLPTLICEKCLLRLKISYDFIKLSRDSDTILKSFINKVGKDFQQVTKTNNEEVENNDEELLLSDKETEEVPAIRTEKRKSTPIKCYKPKLSKKSKSIEHIDNVVYETKTDHSDVRAKSSSNTVFLIEEEYDGEMESPNSNEQEKAQVVVYKIGDFIDTTENNDKETDLKLQEQIADSEEDVLTDEYFQEYETLMDVENSIEYAEEENVEEERKFMRELHLYENVEHVLQADVETLQVQQATELNIETLNSQSSAEDLISAEQVEEHDEEDFKVVKQTLKTNHKRNTKAFSNTKARIICNICNRDFSTRQNLNRHMDLHDGNKAFECKECGKKFSQKGSLKQHALIHTGERPHMCEICNRGFTQWKSLAFHMRRHTGEKPFACEHCGIAFRYKDGYKTHLLKYHLITELSGDTETHVCSICKEELCTETLLKEHMKRHLNKHKDVTVNEKKLAATITTSNVSSNEKDSSMLVEILSEAKEDLWEKEDGEMDVMNILASSTHVVDVMGSSASDPGRAKKFQCRKCFKGFAIVENLVRHLRIHNSEIHQCGSCELSFENKDALKNHCWKAHKESDPNPFECEECQLNLNTTSELKEHLRQDHALVCSHCPKMLFKTSNDLLEHQIDHDEE